MSEVNNPENVKTSVESTEYKVTTKYNGISFGVNEDGEELYFIRFADDFEFISKGVVGTNNQLSFSYGRLMFELANANADFSLLFAQLHQNINDGGSEDENTLKVVHFGRILRDAKITLTGSYHAKGEVENYDDGGSYTYKNDFIAYHITDVVLSKAGQTKLDDIIDKFCDF